MGLPGRTRQPGSLAGVTARRSTCAYGSPPTWQPGAPRHPPSVPFITRPPAAPPDLPDGAAARTSRQATPRPAAPIPALPRLGLRPGEFFERLRQSSLGRDANLGRVTEAEFAQALG